jgi:hypothetical protein
MAKSSTGWSTSPTNNTEGELSGHADSAVGALLAAPSKCLPTGHPIDRFLSVGNPCIPNRDAAANR